MAAQRGRFSEAQIRGFLGEAAAGTPIVELCWNHCFSRSTFRAWKARYGTTSGAPTSRFKAGSPRVDNALVAPTTRVGEREQV